MDHPTITVNFYLSRLEEFTRGMRHTNNTGNSEFARHNRPV